MNISTTIFVSLLTLSTLCFAQEKTMECVVSRTNLNLVGAEIDRIDFHVTPDGNSKEDLKFKGQRQVFDGPTFEMTLELNEDGLIASRTISTSVNGVIVSMETENNKKTDTLKALVKDKRGHVIEYAMQCDSAEDFTK